MLRSLALRRAPAPGFVLFSRIASEKIGPTLDAFERQRAIKASYAKLTEEQKKDLNKRAKAEKNSLSIKKTPRTTYADLEAKRGGKKTSSASYRSKAKSSTKGGESWTNFVKREAAKAKAAGKNTKMSDILPSLTKRWRKMTEQTKAKYAPTKKGTTKKSSTKAKK